jgi:phage baseplate assembly protein W
MAVIQTSDASSSILVTKKKSEYSDLSLLFRKHPVLKDITPLKDIDAVKNSVKNLVLTNFHERPFHPEIGSNLTGLLFEPADQFTGIAMREEILRVLKDFEPRITGVRVQILDDSERNRYRIQIGFTVIFSNTDEVVSFNLQRLR